MIKSYVLIATVGILLFSCNENKGNKSIIRAEDNATEHIQENSDAHATDDQKNSEHATAANASSDVSKLNHTFSFTAFKTPDRVGVNGTFNDIKLYNTQEKDTLTQSLAGSNFEIDTHSINTNDATNTRDAKLKEFFFDNLSSTKITGKFISFEDKIAKVSVTMNGVTKDFDFKYNEMNNSILISGTIDMVSDFKATQAFDAIHQACKVLHEDKTWTDVNLNITVKK